MIFSFFILHFGEGGGGDRSRLLVDFELVFCIFYFAFCILVVEEVEVGAGCYWSLSLCFKFCILYFGDEEVRGGSSRFLLEFELVF